MDDYKKSFEEFVKGGRITKSINSFKIKLFLKKGENSLLIAKHIKEFKPGQGEPEKLYWNYWAITISYYSMLYCAKALILTKGYEARDHDAAQVALGYLCVPSEMEKDDLEILNQSYKIFEDEYVKYFEDAKTESHIARYSAIKTYTERRLDEVFENARKFVSKIAIILAD
ncbi:HEPN domain-containing protein [Candidatus Woesearchaeota archaeon]|nr:HEPN domain-containing protein [Candidatus Woesearchaeota archaeon]